MRQMILLASAAIVLGACNAGAEAGPVNNVSRDFPAGSFEAVSLAGPHDVIVTVGGAPSIRAEGDSKLIDQLDIQVVNGTLRVGTKKDGHMSWFSSDERKVVVHVSVPRLTGASIAGSGDLKVDKVEGSSFSASVAGSGDLEIGSLRVDQANFAIAGSGDIEAAGSAGTIEASIAGSGDIDIAGLESRQASASIVGSGDISARATETASVSITGSGNVTMTGGARCSVSKRGSGEARCS